LPPSSFKMMRRTLGLKLDFSQALGKGCRFASSASASALEIWKSAEAVCFDVDSTVIQEEGIDQLAEFCGAGKAVADLTSRAMGGSMKFEDALAARLDLIKPSIQDFRTMESERPPAFTPGIEELVKLLHSRGTHVYLVSGGFRQMIEPLASHLQIPFPDRLYANNVLFNADGTYSGFDDAELTSRSGGKPEVIRQLKEKHGYQTVVMVGDGATDMDARPPADLFIGFGGIVIREPVKAGADWFITDFEELITAFK